MIERSPLSEEIAVLGLGASGMAAARLALHQGASVHVSNLGTDPTAQARARELRELGAHVELGHHDLDRLASARTLVVSPGIRPDTPVLRALRERGVPRISEPEFALRFLPGALIAVTGTNGKTTTTLLVAHLLRAAGLDARAGGNVGGGLAPAASELALLDPTPEWVVLELSSFQLGDMEGPVPRIGVVTSLAPDHLDRYPSLEAYYADKARLFRGATSRSLWVLAGDSADVRALPGDAPGVRLYFALDPSERAPGPGAEEPLSAWIEGGNFWVRIPPAAGGTGEAEALLPTSESPLLGTHNQRNVLAALLTARLAGASAHALRGGLRSFPPLQHRMEPVAEGNEVLWINDSKATNVAAARTALEGMDRPVVVLLGGKDKGEAFAPLAPALALRARVALLYGEAAPRLLAELGSGVGAGVGACELRLMAGGFEEVLEAASAAARPGEAILLSPACSSYDAFQDYIERGERFRAFARQRAGGSPWP